MADNESYEFLKLTNLRATKGLRKSELARKAGVSPNTLNSVESRKGNKLETVMKVFNALNDADCYDGTLNSDELIRKKSPVS